MSLRQAVSPPRVNCGSLKHPEFSGGSQTRIRPGERRCSSNASTEEVLR